MQYSLENTCAGRWRPPFTEHLQCLLLDFRGRKCFFQLVFIADNHNGFCSEPLWKHELNVRSSLQNYSVKKGVFRNFASFTEKQLRWSLFLIELQAFRPAALLKRRLQQRCFPGGFTKFLIKTNLKSAKACFWNLFFHLDCPF